MNPLATYRSTGADWPFGHPERAHGVAMEGWFWRFSDAATRRAVIVLIGVQQHPDGAWALVGLGTSDGGWRQAVVPGAAAHRGRLAVGADGVLRGDDTRVVVDLGPDARLVADLHDRVRWPRSRPFGGSSVFQTVPALNQYWHPWLLGGTASGWVELDGTRWTLDGFATYGEKNWGRGGFPEAWWWGQAQGFVDAACVAFAGGRVHAGPLDTTVTGLVVTWPGGPLLRLGNPGTSPVAAAVTDERWHLDGRMRGWRVVVDGTAPLGDAHVLPVPLVAERRAVPGALEHLAGRLDATVERRGRTVWRGTSRVAGLEHGGLARAAAEAARRPNPPEPGPRPGCAGPTAPAGARAPRS